MKKTILVLLGFICAAAFATDYSFHGNKPYASITGGPVVRALLSYTTDNSGTIVPLGGIVPASDTSFRGDNLYSSISGGPLVPAIVLYTTDGAGNMVPIPPSGSGAVKDFGTNVPAATSANGICLAQTKVAAGNLTLNGAGVSGGSWAAGFDGGRKITFASTGDLHTVNFAITGTAQDGTALTESLAGPNNNTVTGTKYFQTVTQIAVDAAVGTNVTCGYAASLVALRLSRGSHFILSPTNSESLIIAAYKATGPSGYRYKISLKINAPASATITWADGTTPSDTRIYFAGGTEKTPTASGADWFDLAYDGTSASGDEVWYVNSFAQDLKP